MPDGSFTNRGKRRFLEYSCGISALPTNARLALVTATTAPTADSNLLSDVSEIAAGGGYAAGGQTKAWGDGAGELFSGSAENDAGDNATVTLRDVVFTATAGNTIPNSGGKARYLVLCNDQGGGTAADDEVLAFWDLDASGAAGVQTGTGGTLTLSGFKLQLDQAA